MLSTGGAGYWSVSRTHHPRVPGSHRVCRRGGRSAIRAWAVRDEVESGRLRRAMLDGLDEYRDCATDDGLDYVTHDYRHLWRAMQDRRHIGRRAADRTRHFTRPGSFTNFIVGHSTPEGHYE
jgi:hypothetical protein